MQTGQSYVKCIIMPLSCVYCTDESGMNFRGLDALRAFVEAGSIAQAAEKMLRTPPQVSRILAALEEEVGFQILVRKGRNLVLTKRGVEFYRHVEHVLSARDDLQHHARTLRRGEVHAIRIISAPIVAQAMISGALAQFVERNPQIEIQLDARARLELEQMVAAGTFDIGIAGLPLNGDAFEIRPLVEINSVVSVPLGHPLASQEVISFEALARHPIVTMDQPTHIRSHLESLSKQYGRKLKLRVEVPNGLVACQLARAGIGPCLTCPFVARSAGLEGVVLRRFEPALSLRYGLIFPSWAQTNQLVEDLAAEIVAQTQRSLREDWIAPALPQ